LISHLPFTLYLWNRELMQCGPPFFYRFQLYIYNETLLKLRNNRCCNDEIYTEKSKSVNHWFYINWLCQPVELFFYTEWLFVIFLVNEIISKKPCQSHLTGLIRTACFIRVNRNLYHIPYIMNTNCSKCGYKLKSNLVIDMRCILSLDPIGICERVVEKKFFWNIKLIMIFENIIFYRCKEKMKI
jgi:hypothetical protein